MTVYLLPAEQYKVRHRYSNGIGTVLAKGEQENAHGEPEPVSQVLWDDGITTWHFDTALRRMPGEERWAVTFIFENEEIARAVFQSSLPGDLGALEIRIDPATEDEHW